MTDSSAAYLRTLRSQSLTIPLSYLEVEALKQAARREHLPVATWARAVLMKSLLASARDD